MKSKICFFVIFVLTLSCSKFLDQPIMGKDIDTPAYYNNPQNAYMAVIACYNGLTYESNLSTFQWVYGDVMSDDAAKGGGSAADQDEIEFLKTWAARSNNSYLNDTWKGYYVAIHRANIVLSMFPQTNFDAKLKVQYMAEAKFIRAYAYLCLVRLFGDVPLFTAPVDVDDLNNIVRAPFGEVLALINTDLTDAALDLPLTYNSSQVGRATRGAAQALQARVIMYEIGLFKTKTIQDWKRVFDLTGEIINSGVYNLMANYAEIFEEEGENGIESIFELQFSTTNTGYNFDNQGNASSIMVANRGTRDKPEWGWGFNCPTQNLVSAFEPNDPRLFCTVHGQGITDHLYGVFQQVDNQSFQTGYQARKLAVDPAIRPRNQSDSPYNERIIRYADVLLMRAEAAFFLGDENEALARINLVRARARVSTYPKGYDLGTNTYIPTGFVDNLKDITASGSDLLNAIKHERRVELAFESLRYWDLLRWGNYRSTLSAQVQQRFDKCLLRGVPVIPIPNDEVQSWGLTQNPN